MKKTLSLILALLMSLSTASVAFASEVAIEDEVDEVVTEEVVAGPYDDAIKYLGHYGIYKGVDENDLAAEADVNRWQMALFAARIATGWTEDEKWEDGPQNSSEFTDLEGTAAENYYGAISYVNQMGIIEGYGDGTYGPLNGITYQDALTIVVRTLGYQNLEWPWGYIQKAVELGLTEGVVDVAYTDALTRGEVAQIIYNALFAETKNGTTLGLKSFGIEFAWEDVIITASDKDVFGVNAKAPAGFVGFQLIEDGELDGTVYYAKASDFDLEGHDDELAVGASCKVFFEKDADSELVKIIDYKSNYVETIWNEGKTDDEGVAVDAYAIDTALSSKYSLVTKYSKTYLGGASSAVRDEIIIVDALGGIAELTYVGSNYGVDMETGDIVIYETKNGVTTVKEIVWYYNALLKSYYKIILDKENKEIGVKYMDEAEEAKLLKAIEDAAYEYVTTYEKGFATAVGSVDAKSAYASLTVYNVNGKAYGIYEEYKFGYFANGSTKRCGCSGDPARATYTISNKYNYNVAKEVEVTTPETFDVIVEGQCNCEVGAWINPEFDANLQEDGTYANGYVIYSADKYTGELKIVKYINDCEDEDTYVGKGTIKAFDANKEYVVIGGEKLYFNYDNLEGAGIINVNKNSTTKGNYSDILRDYLNQYVEYVVVDGDIVYMTILGKNTANLFVVEKYAGISSDGYIVVDGYWTANAAELTRIRVASFNNNYTGDMFYYATEEKAAKAFTKGSIYTVSSVEADESLNVQIVGEVVKAEDEQGVPYNYYTVYNNEYVSMGAKITITSENAKDGYLTINGAAARDKGYTYIIIGREDYAGYAPIVIYSGKITDTRWAVTGDLINDGNDSVYLIVNAEWTGFWLDRPTMGVVAFLDDHYWFADFDGNTAEDWYLLGAAEYEVEVFDFYTASNIVVKATNLDLDENTVYNTIDGKIVYDTAIEVYTLADLEWALNKAFQDEDAQSADYFFNFFDLKASNIDTLKTLISKDVSKVLFSSGKEYTDLVNEIKAIKLVEFDGKGGIADISNINKAFLEDLYEETGINAIEAFYVYDNATANVYVYACVDQYMYDNTEDKDLIGETVIEAGEDAYITVEADVTVHTEGIDRHTNDVKVVTATVNALTFEFVGAAVEDDTHQAVENHSYYFGNKGECDFEDWHCTVNGKAVYGSIVAGEFEGHDTEDICNLIKAVKVEDLGITLVEGDVKTVVVSFDNNYGTNATITVEVSLIDGVVAVEILDGSAYGIFDKVIPTPVVLLAK